MYAVIFSAKIKQIDDDYLAVAKKMRSLAIDKYGCTDFTAVTEGNKEIAISYWPSQEHIRAWKNDPDHIKAQGLGKERWYSEYKVQVVKVEREYESHT